MIVIIETADIIYNSRLVNLKNIEIGGILNRRILKRTNIEMENIEMRKYCNEKILKQKILKRENIETRKYCNEKILYRGCTVPTKVKMCTNH